MYSRLAMHARHWLGGLVCLLALVALSACGTKGDLTRPEAASAETPKTGEAAPDAGNSPHP